MSDLDIFLEHELPLVNAAVQENIDQVPGLARPAAIHVIESGGKRLRAMLTLLTGRMLGCSHPQLYSLGASVEILHAATLLHDDILDNAPLRRGRPAAHTLYGTPMVILAGDMMLAQALLMLVATDNLRITACLAKAVMHTIEGELKEFAGVRDLGLTQADYLDIITGKTAWMFKASCEIAALMAEAPEEQCRAAGVFGLELGIAFQMVDDALDFSPAEKTGKPTGGDLREGKITPPLLLYLESLPEEERAAFQAEFTSGSMDTDLLERTARRIHEEGYDLKARSIADTHLEKAREALSSFRDCQEKKVLLQLTEYIRQRDI